MPFFLWVILFFFLLSKVFGPNIVHAAAGGIIGSFLGIILCSILVFYDSHTYFTFDKFMTFTVVGSIIGSIQRVIWANS